MFWYKITFCIFVMNTQRLFRLLCSKKMVIKCFKKTAPYYIQLHHIMTSLKNLPNNILDDLLTKEF